MANVLVFQCLFGEGRRLPGVALEAYPQAGMSHYFQRAGGSRHLRRRHDVNSLSMDARDWWNYLPSIAVAYYYARDAMSRLVEL